MGRAKLRSMRTPLLFFLFALVSFAQPRTERGELNGAKFRIDVPENWGGKLVLFCHGYAIQQTGFDQPNAGKDVAEFFSSRGYAVAQSGYSSAGWAIQEAMKDTDALRQYFSRKYGAPKSTYLMGVSMGGEIVTILAEQHPESYDGTMAMCPAVGTTEDVILPGFHFLVVFQHFFPGLLPEPNQIPVDFFVKRPLQASILQTIRDNPEKAASLRSFAHVKTDQELVQLLPITLDANRDLQRRAGGNPFDNRNYIYQGTLDDNAVNDKVERYAADPAAVAFLKTMPAPTGRLRKPLVAMHTTYDPLVSPNLSNNYAEAVRLNGAGSLFRLEYAKRNGHCTFTPDDYTRALQTLVEMAESSGKPQADVRK